MKTIRREKTFGPGRALSLDRNAKIRIQAFARAWSARNRQNRQHKGPLTRAFMDVLQALLWSFHNSRDGRCFPSYERIAETAGCARSTVAEALKVLEWAEVLSWQHRITRMRERCCDLFGREGWRWRVIRTSNVYQFCDPKAAEGHRFASKSENPSGTQDQEILSPRMTQAHDPGSPLERALARFGAVIEEKRLLMNKSGRCNDRH
jgi:Helix-turn-helix domain